MLNKSPVSLSRRRLVRGIPLLAFGLVIPPVLARTDIHQASRILMGTQLELTLQNADSQLLSFAANAAFAEMTRLTDMMSRYRSDSMLNAINLAAGLQPVNISNELMQVLKMAKAVASSSQGAFDSTVGAFKNWSFDVAHPSIATPQQIAEQLPLIGSHGLVLDERRSTAYLTKRGMRLDLGGIAKLPILQAGMKKLLELGVSKAMINGGGDVLVQGQLNGRDWRIGLRDPRHPEKLLGTISLNKGFVASSGDYERFLIQDGKRLHHILDPKSGYPTQGPRGVTLVSENLEKINGLGTAIMVSGAQAGRTKIQQLAGVDALIVDRDNQLWTSHGMARRLIAA